MDEELARIYGNSFYNTRTMKKNRKFEELSGDYYINSFIKNGRDILSKSKNELLDNGYYIDFDGTMVK